MRVSRRCRWPCLLVFLTLWHPVRIQAQTTPPEDITVIGTSPLLGSGVDRDKVPGQTTVLSAADIARTGTPDLLRALDTQIAGVNLDSVSGNQFQPSLFYDGFEASPLQGAPQGIALYVNGVRFNQAFGDTSNFDLIPDLAIDRLNVEGSNPVFGLNALGGSINARLKNGFSYHGGEVDLSGGSFGQMQGELQYGARRGGIAFYAAGSVLHQDGWRDLQGSDIQTFFSDLGWRGSGSGGGSTEVHLGITLGNSVLNGPGSAPVQLIAADPRAQFTAPNLIANKIAQASLSGVTDLTDTLSVQTLAYGSNFQQRVGNGNTANDAPCGDGSGLLCSSPGAISTTRGGAVIADTRNGGPYSELDEQTTNTNAYGASVQVTDTQDVRGLHNHAVAGVSFDGAQTEFSATGLLGGLSRISRMFLGPGTTIDEPGVNVPVRLAVADAYTGLFASDTLDVTGRLSLTLSARFNTAEVDLSDQGGGTLTGQHAYDSFNPAAGATYRATSWLTLYGGFAQANRAPTPAELSCAGPADACSLANFFAGDPNLRQVVAHTLELGGRGHVVLAGGRLGYGIGLFRTNADDDIAFINSVTLGRAYFANIGATRRQGLSAHADWRGGRFSAHLFYTHTEATFLDGFVGAAGNNPAADANGNVTVQRGDRLPGIPRDVIKAGGEIMLTPACNVGLEAVRQSSQVLFGDAANLTAPLPGFFRLDLHGSYQVTPHVQLFASVQNATNARIFTFGTFAPTSRVFLAQAPHATDPRSYTLAAPPGVFGGVRMAF